MKNPLISIVLLVSVMCGVFGQAAAGPVVQAGSGYSVYVEGVDSGNAFTGTGVFGGAPSVFTRAGLTLTLTTSEMVLGGGNSQITVDLSANGDLFPAPNETGLVGLGVDGDGLDFIIPVSLTDARIRLYAGEAFLGESQNLVPLFMPPVPWDGFFPSTGNVFAIDELGGIGVSRFVFVFQVSEIGQLQVPEPGSLVLGAIGLLAFAGARIRRRKQSL